jgi:hypothetical protein
MQPTIQNDLCQVELKTREFWCGIRGNKVVRFDLAGAAHLVVVSRLSLVDLEKRSLQALINGLYR